MEKELNRKIFGTKKRGSRSLRKPRKDKKCFVLASCAPIKMRMTIRYRFEI
jgi:hypothetical protein